MDEIPLTGGGRNAVWRRGDTVLRQTGPWATSVHALLRHLETVGFEGAPRVIDPAFDGQDREVLSFIEGEFVHPHAWSEDALPSLGRLLKELHLATESFTEPADAIWRDWHGRSLGDASAGFGHCDTGPWNIVARNASPFALIDWEVAGPVDPEYELAHMCWLNAQLHADDVAELQGLAPLKDRARHLALIVEGYELPQNKRVSLVDKMIEFAIHDAAAEAEQAHVTPDTRDPEALWGITWRTKSAAWMLRHRAVLVKALG